MAKTQDMNEEAHKSKNEPKEEVVDTLNEENEEKGTHHFLKKC